MLYTIGYQHLSPAELARIARDLDATIIDVRGSPSGRVKRGFSRVALTADYRERYAWHGHHLGNRGANRMTEAGIAFATSLAADKARAFILLCQEEAPAECHRHAIACQIPYPVRHIFRNEIVLASELQRSIVEGTEYDYDEAPVASSDEDDDCSLSATMGRMECC